MCMQTMSLLFVYKGQFFLATRYDLTNIFLNIYILDYLFLQIYSWTLNKSSVFS